MTDLDKLTCSLTTKTREEQEAQGRVFIENIIKYCQLKRQVRDYRMTIINNTATFNYKWGI